jgi:hypothetical protein
LYYYGQQINEIKASLTDPAKIEATVIKYLKKIPAFNKFIQQNGQLAQIFGSSTTTPVVGTGTLAGLQTTASLQQQLQSRLGTTANSGFNPQQFLNTRMQAATNAMQQQKTKAQNIFKNLVTKYMPPSLTPSSSDDIMPNFTPNGQKTKPFLKRLEKSFNFQTTQRNGYYPSANDIGLSLGYKLNDKSVIGIGLAYKFGIGQNIQKLKWSSEGISLRTYADIKWRGNWWLTGGYEQNYWQRFGNIATLKNAAWVKTGLLGLSKKIARGKKEIKVQLLYDFLQPYNGKLPLVFRWGKNF